MKKTFGAALMAVGMVAVCQAQNYGRTTYHGPVGTGAWTAVSGVSCVVTNGGVWTNAVAVTNWYRVGGTNLAGRLPIGTNVMAAWTGSTNASAVRIGWARKYGVLAHVVERSTDGGATWTNWAAVGAAVTNYVDYGSNTWQTTEFAARAEIAAPTTPWDGMAGTQSVAAAMATGMAAQAAADAAMQEAQRGPTNVTGLLTWTDRVIGLTAAAVSNVMAGVYDLVGHLHDYTAITNAPWANHADYVVTSNQAAGAVQTNHTSGFVHIEQGLSLGNGIAGNGTYALSVGKGSRAYGYASLAQGKTAYTYGHQSVALGENVKATNDNVFVWGDGSVTFIDATQQTYNVWAINGIYLLGGIIYGNGAGVSNLSPPQIGAVWRTNQVLGIDGSTNTIIYMGAP